MNVIALLCTLVLSAGGLLFLLGIIVFRENPGLRIHRVLAFLLIFAALGLVSGAVSLSITANQLGDAQRSFLDRIAHVWEFFFPMFFYFALLFPTENRLIKNHPRIITFLFIPFFVRFGVTLVFPDYEVMRSVLIFETPDGIGGILLQPLLFASVTAVNIFRVFYRQQSFLFAFINLLLLLVGISRMIFVYTKLKQQDIRQRTWPVLWSFCLGAGTFAGIFLVPSLFDSPLDVGLSFAFIGPVALMTAGVLGFAIIKYQFLNVRSAVKKGLGFSLAACLLIGGYLFIYGQAKRLLYAVFDIRIPFIEIIFLLVAVFFFQPIIDLLNAFVDRYVSKKKDYFPVLQQLGYEILSTSDFESIIVRLMAALADSLEVNSACLLIPNEEGFFVPVKAPENNQIRFHRTSVCIQEIAKYRQTIPVNRIINAVESGRERKNIRALKPDLFTPLYNQDKLSGVLVVGERKERREYSQSDHVLLSLVGLQISLALETARLSKIVQIQRYYEKELSVARQIQRMLLPQETPVGKSFRLTSFNIPSKEVGGDYHDFITLAPGQFGIAIGDIAGKGVPGSILMSNLQASLRAAATVGRPPHHVLTDVNVQLVRTTTPEK
ncbi:SpoIIE family protein phosphatase, partial [candidate division KSB1 bacterium]|nr:SpoIIE family protein phosphatase [candidate division KSB1 bacterium]